MCNFTSYQEHYGLRNALVTQKLLHHKCTSRPPPQPTHSGCADIAELVTSDWLHD